jgi:hypothetical protein
MEGIRKNNNVAKGRLHDYLKFKIQGTGNANGPPEQGQKPRIEEFITKVFFS